MNRNELDVGLTRHVQGLDVDVCGFDLVGWSRMPRHALVCYTSANRQVAIERLQERVASRVKGSTSPLCCLDTVP